MRGVRVRLSRNVLAFSLGKTYAELPPQVLHVHSARWGLMCVTWADLSFSCLVARDSFLNVPFVACLLFVPCDGILISQQCKAPDFTGLTGACSSFFASVKDSVQAECPPACRAALLAMTQSCGYDAALFLL